jgi:imidazolonepropionase-like amidohydrolase
MRARQMALIPTLKLYQWDLERTGHAAENHPLLLTAVAQLRTYAAAGGQILFGTDVGFMSDYSPVAEYKLMAQAGLSFPQILAALTTNPAQRFRLSQQTGTIEAGKRADLVLLRADPAVNIEHLGQVAYTISKGRIIYQHR